MKSIIDMMPKYLFSKNEFFSNHIIQWLFAFAFFLHILVWGVCIWFFHRDDGLITLRFNVYLGSDPTSMSPWYAPYQIPLMGLLTFAIQIILSWMFFRERDRVMAHLMLLCGGIVQIVALIALVSVVLENRHSG